MAAVKQARTALGVTGFVAIKKGTALYKKAKELYAPMDVVHLRPCAADPFQPADGAGEQIALFRRHHEECKAMKNTLKFSQSPPTMAELQALEKKIHDFTDDQFKRFLSFLRIHFAVNPLAPDIELPIASYTSQQRRQLVDFVNRVQESSFSIDSLHA